MDAVFDSMYYSYGELIGGIDESGVSDIAGPLVAACVILPKIDFHLHNLKIFEVNDSKKIPEKYRKEHAEMVWQVAMAIGIGEVQPCEIDYLGRDGSVKLAMMRAIAACKRTTNKKLVTPSFLLIDGTLDIPTSIPHKGIVQADTKSLCVASASIVAKVYRDDIMIKLHNEHPEYDWANNKGYPCENQFVGIDTHGAQLGIHRTNLWPFTPKRHITEDRNAWRKRRDLWKRSTEARICAELENTCIKNESYKPLTKSKSSQEQDQPAP